MTIHDRKNLCCDLWSRIGAHPTPHIWACALCNLQFNHTVLHAKSWVSKNCAKHVPLDSLMTLMLTLHDQLKVHMHRAMNKQSALGLLRLLSSYIRSAQFKQMMSSADWVSGLLKSKSAWLFLIPLPQSCDFTTNALTWILCLLQPDSLDRYACSIRSSWQSIISQNAHWLNVYNKVIHWKHWT